MRDIWYVTQPHEIDAELAILSAPTADCERPEPK
jgi:hypothetical protein